MGKPDLERMTQDSIVRYSARLAQDEPLFSHVLEHYGPPPLWSRPPGFGTLVWIILEQQVSLASARAAYDRLFRQIGEPSPQAFIKLDDVTLKEIGFSRQKAAYCRGLAQTIIDGNLDLECLAHLDDDAVRETLIRLKGIGPWTADIYLLMVLCRPDVWPVQDLGLIVAVQRGLKLERPPGSSEMERIGEAWRPYRSVAARLLWHFYLSEIRPPKTSMDLR